MASADSRIVKLEFDNSDFEKNVAASLTTIGKLNESIAKIGSDGGLKTLSESAKGFNLDGMVSAVEGVSAKFIGLATIGITAIQNLTNRAVDAGIQISKAFTIDPVKAGFNEYEQKLGAIQTIMAGSGESLDTVNQKLQELNTYSDKTIYSFADMTQNIGKFTNAGVSLDMSVASIQGIANAAALAGADAGEASRAMYNFAQALSKGHVELLDWKSIELANMGTVEFKTQLLDAAVATGELTKQGEMYVTSTGRSINATKEFNDSLTDGWLTTEVLTGTLADYADATTEIGARATAAAQDVKTFSQLIDTVKESIGSGWAQSFETIFGNFTEAKSLFTDMNTIFGGLIGANATARNELLQGWKDLGGRQKLIQGFWATIGRGLEVLEPIHEAFREIFPKKTSIDLFLITNAFTNFMESLKPSEKTLENIKRVFKGFFAAIEIGWTILKSVIGVVKDIVSALIDLSGEGALSGLAEIGDWFVELNEKLVKGGGIADFFEKVKEKILDLVPYLEKAKDLFGKVFGKIKDVVEDAIPVFKEIKDAVKDFIDGLDFTKVTAPIDTLRESLGDTSFDTTAFDNLKTRFEEFADAADKVWGSVKRVGDMISESWGKVKGFTTDISGSVKGAVESGDWSGVTDALNTGLLGILTGMFAKLVTGGIDIDLTGGLMKTIKTSLGELTGVLKAMQTELKAEALEHIAIAIGILAGAIFVLSTIDGESLAKAMTAITIGFGQLLGVLKLLDKIDFSSSDVAKMVGIGVALGILAAAIVVLSIAAKIMSTMDWEELAKGLIGTTVLLGLMIGVAKLLKDNTADMVEAGIGIGALAVSLVILSVAVKRFGEMDWEVMAQGLLGTALALGGVALAMKLMPSDMEQKSAGLIGLGIGLTIMSFAMKQMSDMGWEEMVKGMIGVGGGLAAIGFGLSFFPKDMGKKALEILVISTAMVILSEAMETFGELSWSEIGKGIVTIGGTLAILAVALNLMEGSLPGALAMGVIVLSLDKLADLIKVFADIDIVTLATGLLAIGVSLLTLGGVAVLLETAIPFMIGLGLALISIGIGMAAIGIGAKFVAEAVVALAGLGEDGAKGIGKLLIEVGKAIPALGTGLALGIVEFITTIGGYIPKIVEVLVNILSELLDGLIKLIPKIAKVVGTLVTEIINYIKEKIPEYARAGLEILLGLLKGLRDNIGEITTVSIEIVHKFLSALNDNMNQLIIDVAEFFVTMIEGVAKAIGLVAASLFLGIGVNFIEGFIQGMSDSVSKIWDFITGLVETILGWVMSGFGIASPSTVMADLGVNVILGFLNGIIDAAADVISWFTDLAGNVLSWIGDTAMTLASKGLDMIGGFFSGLLEKAIEVQQWFNDLAGTVFGWIGNVVKTIFSKGWDFIKGLFDGIVEKALSVQTWFNNLASTVFGWVGNVVTTLWSKGMQLLNGLWEGIKEKFEDVKDWVLKMPGKILEFLGDTLSFLFDAGKNIIQGMLNGLSNAWHLVSDWVSDKVGDLKDMILNPFGIFSPSRFMIDVGGYIMEGLAIGLADAYHQPANNLQDSVDGLMTTMSNGVKDLNKITSDLEMDLSPTIRPVMDLTQFTSDAKKLEKMMPSNSTMQAGIISGYNPGQVQPLESTQTPATVTFTQTINAPKQLSTIDIYRQTRNQIAVAKEELNIP